MDLARKRITRKDVARMAGVSTATVSYVLSQSPKVHGETRERVLAAVKTLGYVPDPIARSMVTRRTMQLGIVLNNIANPIYSDMILGFEGKAREQGYFVNICTGRSSLDEYFENFVNRRIDGIFIEALPTKFHMEKVYALVEAGIKVIMFGHGSADLRRVSSVETDYLATMELAVDHLWTLGHRRIAYISGLSPDLSYDLRIAGYLKAMEKRGAGAVAKDLLVCSPGLTDTEIHDGAVLTKRLLGAGSDFTALIATNDLMAIGAIRTLASHGVQVPRKVSVVGIDGANIGDIITPRLTSLGTDYYSLGEKSFELLYMDLQKDMKGFFRNTPSLVLRESTASPPT